MTTLRSQASVIVRVTRQQRRTKESRNTRKESKATKTSENNDFRKTQLKTRNATKAENLMKGTEDKTAKNTAKETASKNDPPTPQVINENATTETPDDLNKTAAKETISNDDPPTPENGNQNAANSSGEERSSSEDPPTLENAAKETSCSDGPASLEDPNPTESHDIATIANPSDNMGQDIILGCIDADLTATFIDSEFRKTHKYVNLECDIYEILSTNARARKLHKDMTKSYAQSFEYVKYAEIDGYQGDNVAFALKARKRLPGKVLIPGIDGYLADAPADAPDFSLFGSKTKGKERIMLGPASFINHCCEPNAKYECGGETKGSTVVRIKTLRQIEVDEEIFVSYDTDYFGPQNEDCRCEICLQTFCATTTTAITRNCLFPINWFPINIAPRLGQIISPFYLAAAKRK